MALSAKSLGFMQSIKIPAIKLTKISVQTPIPTKFFGLVSLFNFFNAIILIINGTINQKLKIKFNIINTLAAVFILFKYSVFYFLFFLIININN
ncbi:hypothetical protein oki361_17310 [Helicobacter pylori]